MVFLKKSASKRFFRLLLNSKGFSLVELMTSMGVSMIIALIASFAFSMA
ncbi:prepilin-type N-terminal cleavage/methylation domain-containing protein, partial [bacterium]|nr:prepilin-type N-terminal cleavage/methylation domain-containing protein [bacterium]